MKKQIFTYILKLIFSLNLIIALTSCASIISGRNQTVTIKTTSGNNNEIYNSNCKITNSKGEWVAKTPESIFIRKSYGDLSINCHNNYYKGSKTYKSSHELAVWGNIIFGGLIGFAIDAGTGAGFSYPQTMYVELK